MATKQQLAQYCIDHAPHIKQGLSMLNLIISNAVSVLIGAGLGWYIKGRGLQGVKNDTANAVTATENVVTEVKAAV
jgi:hypothetical protein